MTSCCFDGGKAKSRVEPRGSPLTATIRCTPSAKILNYYKSPFAFLPPPQPQRFAARRSPAGDWAMRSSWPNRHPMWPFQNDRSPLARTLASRRLSRNLRRPRNVAL